MSRKSIGADQVGQTMAARTQGALDRHNQKENQALAKQLLIGVCGRQVHILS